MFLSCKIILVFHILFSDMSRHMYSRNKLYAFNEHYKRALWQNSIQIVISSH